jgi:hypothetical protein
MEGQYTLSLNKIKYTKYLTYFREKRRSMVEGEKLIILHDKDLVRMDDVTEIFEAFAFEDDEVDLR